VTLLESGGDANGYLRLDLPTVHRLGHVDRLRAMAGVNFFGSMRRGTINFVGATALAAAAMTALVWRLWPDVNPAQMQPLFILGALALTAELLGFVMSSAVVGSIAVIPYLAMVLVVPSWASIASISCVKLIAECRSRSLVRSSFNVAQHALSASAAVLLYRSLGGQSLESFLNVTFIHASLAVGLPATIAVVASSGVNAFLVSGVVAASTGRPLMTAWRENFRAPLGFDLLSAPLIFVFAWVFTHFGWIAALTTWVPILGLRQVHKANVDLETTNRELLELLVKSIEARDPYTSGHSRRVQHYSLLIGRVLGLSGLDLEQVGRAALLHDVGKIYEKYAPILAKADRLTPDEWTTMQEHPIDGANLVATMSNLRAIVPSIRHHHENWDGSGYPDGLAGEAIPLAARIITFADTIDAMTSERPYRLPLSENHVRAEMIRCRARQFDPTITDRLLTSPMWKLLFAPHSQIATPSRAMTVIGPRARSAPRSKRA
jgi:putative nucleotidyltransferase with HDIG domain